MGALAPTKRDIDYFDDYLNVCALLREKANRAMQENGQIAAEQKKTDQ